MKRFRVEGDQIINSGSGKSVLSCSDPVLIQTIAKALHDALVEGVYIGMMDSTLSDQIVMEDAGLVRPEAIRV